jgi:hypothetical protein
MTTLIAKVASALSFAHLAGVGRTSAKGKGKAEDDDKPERDHEDTSAEDDDDDKRCEDEDTGAKGKAEGDDDDKGDDDKKDGKAKSKGKAASDEDDDDEKDEDKAKAAAMTERKRCASIFASPAASKNVQLACELAFNTDLTSAQAIAILEKSPSASSNFAERSARNPRVGAGGGSQPNSEQAISASWDAAFAKVTPKSRR